MMRKWHIAFVGLAGLSFAGAVVAQGTAADVIKARQAGMKAVGAGFKGLNEQLRGTPDVEIVKRHAGAIAAQAPKVPGWFGPGTASAPGVKTGARPEIWTRAADFRKAAADLDLQAKRTLALAEAGDMTALGPQLRVLGGACKTCHDSFRAKDD